MSAFVELKPHQRKHYEDLIKALGLDPTYKGFTDMSVLDTSPTGAGKTSVNTAVAAFSQVPNIQVICPNIVKLNWIKTLNWFNLSAEIWDYNEIIAHGESGRYTKFELTIEDEAGNYQPSVKLADLCKEGLFLIVDEASHFKNPGSKRSKSLFAVSSFMRDYENCYITYLSATPTDKPEVKYTWLAHLGIMNVMEPFKIALRGRKPVYITDGLSSIKKWLKEEKDYIKDIKPVMVVNDEKTYKFKPATFDQIYMVVMDGIDDPRAKGKMSAAFVYDKIAIPLLMYSMPNRTDLLAYSLLATNMFTEREEAHIQDALGRKAFLEKETERKIANHEPVSWADFWQKIVPILRDIEIEKAKLFARICRRLLKEYPNMKIVIQMNYYEALTVLFDRLERYKLLRRTTRILGKELTGQVMRIEEREKQRRRFQQFNDRYRIMIVSNVAQMGIDLDDQSPDGKYPRFLMAPTTYNTINLMQVFGRISRTSTTSNSVAAVIFYSLAEKLKPRHQQKCEALYETTKQGCIPITTKTPYMRCDGRGENCELLTIPYESVKAFMTPAEEDERRLKGKVRDVETIIMEATPDLKLGIYNQDAYDAYLKTNPKDVIGLDEPKDPRYFKIVYNYKNDKKNKRIYIGTDLKIDWEKIDRMTNNELKFLIEMYFYTLFDEDRKIANIVSKEMTTEAPDLIHFFFPGFREQKYDKYFVVELAILKGNKELDTLLTIGVRNKTDSDEINNMNDDELGKVINEYYKSINSKRKVVKIINKEKPKMVEDIDFYYPDFDEAGSEELEVNEFLTDVSDLSTTSSYVSGGTETIPEYSDTEPGEDSADESATEQEGQGEQEQEKQEEQDGLPPTRPIVHYVKSDLLDADTQYIAHQVNATTVGSGKGLSKQIFAKYPNANVYKSNIERIPGTIITVEPVINIVGQQKPGKPSGNDSEARRLRWFKSGLEEISEIEGIVSIAFPFGIGSGLAGGNWEYYEKMIQDFAVNNPNIKVFIYKLE